MLIVAPFSECGHVINEVLRDEKFKMICDERGTQ